jgi:hypothetical protein
MFFRGTNNTLNHLKYLNDNYGLYSASDIVLTGISAGGLAVLYWANFIQDLSMKAKVYAIPDSAIFVTDFVNPLTNQVVPNYLNDLFKLTNI